MPGQSQPAEAGTFDDSSDQDDGDDDDTASSGFSKGTRAPGAVCPPSGLIIPACFPGDGIGDGGQISGPTSPSNILSAKRQITAELADPLSPKNGRLADRIIILRARCIEGLGDARFQKAYTYLKALQDADEAEGAEFEIGGEAFGGLHNSEEEAHRKLRQILGGENLHYSSLIDQLIFMEETI